MGYPRIDFCCCGGISVLTSVVQSELADPAPLHLFRRHFSLWCDWNGDFGINDRVKLRE